MSSFTESTPIFEGDDINAWYSHFKLEYMKEQINDTLGEIRNVSDFRDVCPDLEMMQLLLDKIKKIGLKKFVGAIKKTAILRDLVVVEPVSLKTETMESKTDVERSMTTTEVRRKLDSEKKKVSEKEKLLSDLEHMRLRETELNNKIGRTSRKLLLIQRLEEKLKAATSLDLLFLLDCTGSMAGHIRGTQENIIKLVDEVKKLVPDLCVRLGFIGYRDHCDGTNRLAVFRFSNDVQAFKDFVGGQGATGGGDAPEDVFGALNVAVGFEWQSTTRILVHTGDAPCHGRKYHEGLGDDHPDGDPNGLRAEVFLPKLKEQNIFYFFGKINETTNKMITEFNKIFGDRYIATLNAGNANGFMDTITASVSTSLSTSMSSSHSLYKIDKGDLDLDKNIPNWTKIKSEQALKYDKVLPTSMDSLINDEFFQCVQVTPVAIHIKTGAKPFDAGACRMAVRGCVVDNRGNIIENVIHKISLGKDPKHHTREKFESNWIRTQVAATFLAQEFNKVKPSSFPQIEYVDVCLIQYLERKNTPYCLQESSIDGHWEKYNNNRGMIAPSGGTDHRVIQAFSHWTYHITRGSIMVVDCQGVFDASRNRFILTDPAIHCTSIDRFGGTNMNLTGMYNFSVTHVCNDCCKAMKLPALSIPPPPKVH